MPTGNYWVKTTSTGGKCPKHLLSLRNTVKRLISQDARCIKTYLAEHVAKSYPEFWESIKAPSRRKLFYNDLFCKGLGLPMTGRCLTCGATTEFYPDGFCPRKFCSTGCSARSDSTREAFRRTCIKTHGCSHPSQTTKFWDKYRETYRLKTGYENPSQNPELVARTRSKSMQTKRFFSTSGRVYPYQGYEGVLLERLDKNPEVIRFTTIPNDEILPTISYKHLGKIRTYYPDIGVLYRNGRRLVIEVKSEYTLWSDEHRNRAKFKAATSYCNSNETEFWLAVYDPKTRRFVWSS